MVLLWKIIKRVIRKLRANGYRRRVERALALYLRGEGRRDGLQLVSVRNHMQIDWQARHVHPWDRERPAHERNSLFVTHCLADTDAAISRLFEAFPHIDAMQICVSEFDSEQPIMTGAVFRTALETVPAGISTGIRLRAIGITYHSAGSEFEVMDLTVLLKTRAFHRDRRRSVYPTVAVKGAERNILVTELRRRMPEGERVEESRLCMSSGKMEAMIASHPARGQGGTSGYFDC